MGDVYTHGHHEACSAATPGAPRRTRPAYLLPHLSAGMDLLDVGCGPGTITVDLARRVAPGRVLGDRPRRGRRRDGPGTRRRSHGTPAPIEFRAGDVYRSTRPTTPSTSSHAHQVLQHLTRPGGRPRRGAPGAAARRRARGPRQRLRRVRLGAAPTRRSIAGSSCTTRSPRATGPRPTPAATSRLGARRRGSSTSASPARPGRSPTTRAGTGGAASGPNGSSVVVRHPGRRVRPRRRGRAGRHRGRMAGVDRPPPTACSSSRQSRCIARR